MWGDLLLNYVSIKALSECTIEDSVLRLPDEIPEREFRELVLKLRAAILNHKIPIYKPVAALFDGMPTLPRVTSVGKGVSKTYLGMLPELSYCICMPLEDLKTVPGVWEKKKKKDLLEMPNDKLVWAKSLGMRDLMFVRSIDDGDITLDKCIYSLDMEKYDNQRIYVKPLLRDCAPIVSINGEGAFIGLNMVLACSCNTSSCADVIKTIGNIAKNYVQVEQIYGLEEFLFVSPMDLGVGKIKFTYKRDIDEEVLTEIIRRFAKKLLVYFESSLEQLGTPAYTFCRGTVRDVDDMWEAV